MSGDPPEQFTLPEDENLYCLECGYNLRGLAGMVRTCPECGHVNRLDPSCVRAEVVVRMRKRLHGRADSGALALLFLLLSVFSTVLLGSPGGLVFVIIAMVIWLSFTSLSVDGEGIDAGSLRSVMVYQLWVALLCALVFLFVLGLSWETPPLDRFGQYPADPLAYSVVASFVVACLLVWAFGIRRAKGKMVLQLDEAAQRMAQAWHSRRLRTPPDERGFF